MSKKARRELIAFAFVEEEYLRTGDITLGLLPLFRPILARYSGNPPIFSSADKWNHAVMAVFTFSVIWRGQGFQSLLAVLPFKVSCPQTEDNNV